MSAIEESVIRKMRERAALGLTKYGVSLADAPLTRLQLLKHAQEEAMDLAAYLETLIQKEELEDVWVNEAQRLKIFAAGWDAAKAKKRRSRKRT